MQQLARILLQMQPLDADGALSPPESSTIHLALAHDRRLVLV